MKIPESTINEIKRHGLDIIDRHAQRDKSKKGWVCPECKNGTGDDGDGLREYRKQPGTLHCFACGKNFDIIDIIQKERGVSFVEAAKLAAAELGISIPDNDTSSLTAKNSPNLNAGCEPYRMHPENSNEAENGGNCTKTPRPDYTAYYADLDRLEDPAARAYVEGRGISTKTARAAGILYDRKKKQIIIPKDKSEYMYRPIKADGSKAGKTYFLKEAEGGRAWPFNLQALKRGTPCAIVEGWEDALSVQEVGGAAVAVNAATHDKAFIAAIDDLRREGRDVPPLILALDNDDAGKTGMDKIAAALKERGLFYVRANLADGANDPNDALRANRAQFAAAVKSATTSAQDAAQRAKDIPLSDPEPAIMPNGEYDPADDPTARAIAEAENAALKQTIKTGTMNVDTCLMLYERIKDMTNGRLSTGLAPIDSVLGGGIYPGLFTIGGMTGTGKTTLALQIGDHIAAHGRPVLYIALEMSQEEIMAKSMARMMYQEQTKVEPDPSHVVAWSDILDAGSWYGKLGTKPGEIVEACGKYANEIGKNVCIIEGVAETDVNAVRRLAELMAEERGVSPVVIIDYLQIMKPVKDNMTDKQAADFNTVALKRLSRELKTPVIVLSAFNRNAYGKYDKDMKPLTHEQIAEKLAGANRDTSTIEYTGDACLALWEGKKSDLWNDVDLYLIKNRRARKPDKPVELSWRGDANIFEKR